MALSPIVSVYASNIFPCTTKFRRSFLLAPAHVGSPGKRDAKWLCMCVCSTHRNDIEEQAYRQQCPPFCQKSDGVWRKDEARSLIYVKHPSVLWHYWLPIIPKGSLPKTSGGKTKVDMTNPSTPGKWLVKMERLAHCTVNQQLIAVNKEHAWIHCKQHLDWTPSQWRHGTRDMLDQVQPTTYSNVCRCRLNQVITMSTVVTRQQRLDTTARLVINWRRRGRPFMKAN